MISQRYKRLKQVLDRRQPDLTVLMENVHKAHNLAAIIRSCDAVGALEAHAVSSHKNIRMRQKAASGSSKWVRLNLHPTLDQAVEFLKHTNHQIIAVHIDEHAMDYKQVNFVQPTALLMGQELDGLTESAIALADKTIQIPMLGMVESLNVSVATALILYEAMEQRQKAGLYDNCRIDDVRYQQILFEWAYPRMAKLLSSKGKAYPVIDWNKVSRDND